MISRIFPLSAGSSFNFALICIYNGIKWHCVQTQCHSYLGENSLHITFHYSDGALIICLEGELDHHSAALTLRETRKILDRFMPKSCGMDLSRLAFMDSSGIAFILRVRQILRSYGASFRILDPAEQPDRVIVASGLGRLVSVKHTESESTV